MAFYFHFFGSICRKRRFKKKNEVMNVPFLYVLWRKSDTL